MSTMTNPQAIMAPPALDLGAPFGAPAPTEGAGAGAADFLRVVKQRKLTILITFVVLYLAVIGATLAIHQWVPLYTSEAILELDPPRAPMVVDPELMNINPDVIKQSIQTEARKIKQLALMFKVLELPQIKETEFYKWYYPEVGRAAYELNRTLVCAPIPDTNLIRLSLSIRNKQQARDIVRAVVNTYLTHYVTESKDELFARLDGMRNTLAEGQRKLKEKREDINRFREGVETSAMEEGRAMTANLLDKLQMQQTEVDVVLTSLQADMDAIRDIPINELPITPEMRLLIEADPILRYYRSTVESYDVQLRTMETLIGKSHRNMKFLEAQRRAWYEKELSRREELVNDIRERQVESIRQDAAKYRAVMMRLQGQIEEASAQQRDLDRNLQRYKQMVVDEKMLVEELTELQYRTSEAEHAWRDKSRERRLRVVQNAEEAVKPTRPDYWLYLGGGLVLALGGAVGFAFLREYTDKAIRTPIDVSRFGQLAVLGNVPLIDDEEADVESIELAARKAPHSLVAEAFRQVRSNLLFSGPAESQRSILITSPGPGDGKTAVAINLAVTLARSNQRVLLIDCNFRRPAIREAFSGTRREGLSNLLIGQGKLDDYVAKTDVHNVFVLSSGPMPPTPAELLDSTYMTDLIGEAVRKYDRVILDGPPALLINDAIVLARKVDGVIIVARAVTNSKGALRRTREQLERINARVFGAVLNGVQARPGGYFRRQYRDFYDYAAETDGTPAPELPESASGDGEK